MKTVSILQCFTSNEIFLISKGTFDAYIPYMSVKYTRLGQLEGKRTVRKRKLNSGAFNCCTVTPAGDIDLTHY